VFVRHALPNGLMTHRGRPVRTETIRRTALFTVEGERDDISGVGQTRAAHALCTNLPYDKKQHFLAIGVGHYGVFNGSRFRAEIVPRISDFVVKHDVPAERRKMAPSKALNGQRARGIEKRLADATGLTALAGKNLSEITQGLTQELTEIVGIGPKMLESLNELGIFEVGQLAELTDDAMRALDEQLNGRPGREDWFGQARRLKGRSD
jgi:poly(3-hydroxybutyrate) depolymerase